MAVQKLTWSGAHGAAATIGNTGYTALSATDGGTIVFDNAWMPREVIALKATGTSTSGIVNGRLEVTATDALALDQPIKPLLLPNTELQFLYFGVAETRNVGVTVDQLGVVRIRDAANTAIWTSTADALQVGVGVIVSVFFTRHASAGAVRVVIYEEDETTVRRDSGLLTGRNTGAAATTRTRTSAAKGSTSTSPATYLFGEPRYDIAATGLLEPVSAHWPAHFAVGGVAVPVNVHLAVGGVAVQII